MNKACTHEGKEGGGKKTEDEGVVSEEVHVGVVSIGDGDLR